MEIAKQIISKDMTSKYLQKQSDEFSKACDALQAIESGGHLTSFQRLILGQISQTLTEMSRAHRLAMAEVKAHEKEEERLTEKAKDLLVNISSHLNIAGKIALVAYDSPYLLGRDQLTMNSDAGELVGEKFQRVLTTMAGAAAYEAIRQNITINAAIDELWEKFEESRPAIEKKLSGRIRSYEKQLALSAQQFIVGLNNVAASPG